MAQYRPRKDLDGVFKPKDLEPGDIYFSIWSRVFTSTIGSENEFGKDASTRLKETFGDDAVLREYELPNGCRMDCAILESPNGIPRALVEYKKPPSAEGGIGARKLNLLLHSAQAINYGSQIMFKYPEIGILPIVITDGRSFTAGYGKRDSLGHLVIVLCVDSFTLYANGQMGTDFGLFWAMCNYSGPKCSLEVVVQEEPLVTVRVSRCIGHGASSFVYEASLAENSVAVQDEASVYSKLKALNGFAIKITKAGQGDSWLSEKRAIKSLAEKQLQGTCVFPIHWGESQPYYFFIYPLGVPVFPTIDTKAGKRNLLTSVHFAGLLKDLCAIHTAGLVHRDIRLANIVMVGEAAKLIDFGYATTPTSSMQLVGTLVTASQAILEAAYNGYSISYGFEDDLESLFKVFMSRRNKVDTECEEGKEGVRTLYFAWRDIVAGCGLRRRSYEQMVSYLADLFAMEDEAWETDEADEDAGMPE